MSDPSDPRSEDPMAPAQPTTREIPVVQPAAAAAHLPPHPGATPPGPVPPPGPFAEPVVPVAPPPVDAAQPTGPVDFVPGLPGAGTPPPPPAPAASGPAGATAASAAVWPHTLEPDQRRPPPGGPSRDRGAWLATGLAVVAVLLLELGLSLTFGAQRLWSVIPLWSAFATLAAVVTLLALAGAALSRLNGGTALRAAAAGLAGVALFWVLVVLPSADSDRGFVLTAALGFLGTAVWIRGRGTD